MAELLIDKNSCTMCGVCVDCCPFDALVMHYDGITVNEACKMCRLCIKQCPENAIFISEIKTGIDKSEWQGYLVFVEYVEGKMHPVAIELIGKAEKLAEQTKMPVSAVIIGSNTSAMPSKLLDYGVDEVFIYDDERLREFRVDSYASVLEDLIKEIKPSVVLIGGTSIGRSLAPRTATRFRTGLTADCTSLEIKKNTDLVQIRPAFGGNIMAQIITPRTRPQFATVRYKVMDRAEKRQPHGKLTYRAVTDRLAASAIEVISIVKKQAEPSITEADALVVAGQGVKKVEDLEMIKELAALVGGEYACTRPLVEKGWCDYTRQIGLSGRTVKPKLLIACGVSGAIQFTACMDAAEKIVAINTDGAAPIMKISHCGIIGNIYDVVPSLINKIKGAVSYAV